MDAQIVMANARYWVQRVEQSQPLALSKAEIAGAARALTALLNISDAWPLTLAFATQLHPVFEQRGLWGEWERMLYYLVTLAQARHDRAAELDLQVKRGALLHQRRQTNAAVASYRRVWRLSQDLGRRSEYAIALSNLGDLYRLRGEVWRAQALCTGAIHVFREQGDKTREAYTENHLGLIFLSQRDWEQARVHLIRSQALSDETQDDRGTARALQNLGILHYHTGDYERALEYLEQAIQHYEVGGYEAHITKARLNIGLFLSMQGKFSTAETIDLEVERELQTLGDQLNLARVRHNLGMVYTALERWESGQQCFEQAIAYWRTVEDRWNWANSLGDKAALHLAAGQWDKARATVQAAWTLIEDQESARYRALQQSIKEKAQKLGAPLEP
ncbi:MAG: tetratricopeptide repeat protein [Anaerolineae bacterium]|nr:tetratricopeptide repeat protein [Anaerolineae bacterium]